MNKGYVRISILRGPLWLLSEELIAAQHFKLKQRGQLGDHCSGPGPG